MTEEFERLIKQLADAVLSQVASELDQGTWANAYFDARFDAQEKSWLGKLRITKADTGILSIGVSTELSLILIDLEQHRHLGPDDWYGVLVSVTPDRRCQVKLNYDPECAHGASFFETYGKVDPDVSSQLPLRDVTSRPI